jgi:hypothetical protein
MTAALCHCAQMIQGPYDPAKSVAVAIGTFVAHSMGTRELARWRGAVSTPRGKTPVLGRVPGPRGGASQVCGKGERMMEEGMLSIARRGDTYQVRYASTNPYSVDRLPSQYPDESTLVALLQHWGIETWSIQRVRATVRGGGMAVLLIRFTAAQLQAAFPLQRAPYMCLDARGKGGQTHPPAPDESTCSSRMGTWAAPALASSPHGVATRPGTVGHSRQSTTDHGGDHSYSRAYAGDDRSALANCPASPATTRRLGCAWPHIAILRLPSYGPFSTPDSDSACNPT